LAFHKDGKHTPYCGICHDSCLTCTGPTDGECTSCKNAAQSLFQGKCYDGYPCANKYKNFVKYDKKLHKCVDVCGDGVVFSRLIQGYCDDGNSKNGDGCSSSCRVESNWQCSGGNKTHPDFCMNTLALSVSIEVSAFDPNQISVNFNKDIDWDTVLY